MVVRGRAQNKILSDFTNSLRNHKSMENTAFNIYTTKLIAEFAAIDNSEIIDRNSSPRQNFKKTSHLILL